MHCSGTHGPVVFIIAVIFITSRFETVCHPAITRRHAAKDHEPETPEYEEPRPIFSFPSFTIPVNIPDFKDYHSNPQFQNQTALPDYYDYLSNASTEYYDFFDSSHDEPLDYFEPDQEFIQSEDGAAAQQIQNETPTPDSLSTTIRDISNSNGTRPSGPLHNIPYPPTTSQNIPSIYPGLSLTTSPSPSFSEVNFRPFVTAFTHPSREMKSTSTPKQFHLQTATIPHSSKGTRAGGVMPTNGNTVGVTTTVPASESNIRNNTPLNKVTPSKAHQDNEAGKITVETETTTETEAQFVDILTAPQEFRDFTGFEIYHNEATLPINNHLQVSTDSSRFYSSEEPLDASLSVRDTLTTEPAIDIELSVTPSGVDESNTFTQLDSFSTLSDHDDHDTLTSEMDPSGMSHAIVGDHDSDYPVDPSASTISISEDEIGLAISERLEAFLTEASTDLDDPIQRPGEDVSEASVSPLTEDDASSPFSATPTSTTELSELFSVENNLSQEWPVTPQFTSDEHHSIPLEQETDEIPSEVQDQIPAAQGLDDHNEATVPMDDRLDSSSDSSRFHSSEEPPDAKSSDHGTLTTEAIDNESSLPPSRMDESMTFTQLDQEDHDTLTSEVDHSEMSITVAADNDLDYSLDHSIPTTIRLEDELHFMQPIETLLSEAFTVLDDTIPRPGEDVIEARVSPSTDDDTSSPFSATQTSTSELNEVFSLENNHSETPDQSTDLPQELPSTSPSSPYESHSIPLEQETDEIPSEVQDQIPAAQGFDNNDHFEEFETDHSEATLPKDDSLQLSTDSSRFYPSEEPPDASSSTWDALTTEPEIDNELSLTSSSMDESNTFTQLDSFSTYSDQEDVDTFKSETDRSEIFPADNDSDYPVDHSASTISMLEDEIGFAISERLETFLTEASTDLDDPIQRPGEDVSEASVSPSTEDDASSPFSATPTSTTELSELFSVENNLSQEWPVTPQSSSDEPHSIPLEQETAESPSEVQDENPAAPGLDDNDQFSGFETDHNETTLPMDDYFDLSTASGRFHPSEEPSDASSSERDTLTTEPAIDIDLIGTPGGMDESNTFTQLDSFSTFSGQKDYDTLTSKVDPSEMSIASAGDHYVDYPVDHSTSTTSKTEGQMFPDPRGTIFTEASTDMDDSILHPGDDVNEAPGIPSTEGDTSSPFIATPTSATELNELFPVENNLSERTDLSTDLPQELPTPPPSSSDEPLSIPLEQETDEIPSEVLDKILAAPGLNDNDQFAGFKADHNEATLPINDHLDRSADSGRFHPSKETADASSSEHDTLTTEPAINDELSLTPSRKDGFSNQEDQDTLTSEKDPSEMSPDDEADYLTKYIHSVG